MPEQAKSPPPLGGESFARMIFARRWQPNVMVESEEHQVDAVAVALLQCCRQPIAYYRLPGRLDLPAAAAGTLLLADAGALTGEQAQSLDEWLDGQHDGLSVVSVTSVPAEQLLRRREWPERLLFRLNVIRLPARDILGSMAGGVGTM